MIYFIIAYIVIGILQYHVYRNTYINWWNNEMASILNFEEDGKEGLSIAYVVACIPLIGFLLTFTLMGDYFTIRKVKPKTK